MALSITRMLTVGILPSFLKIAYYRMRGAKIGRGVKLGFLSTIEAGRITIGDYSKIGMLVQIKASEFKMGSYSEIGMMTVINALRVRIGNETIIQEQVVIGGMQSRHSLLQIGDRCKIFRYSFINPTRPVIIGDEVGVGGANYIFTHGSWSNSLEGGPIGFGPVVLEDRVWLPWRVFILPNVTIGHDSVIAAGSVVSKSIPPCTLAAGSPAEVKKTGIAFMKKPSPAEKEARLTGILEEFEDCLLMNGLAISDVSDMEKPDGCIWIADVGFKNRGGLERVSVVKSIDEKWIKTVPNSYALSLEPVSQSIKDIIGNEGAWFDLHSYQWGGTRNHLTTEIRAFFHRFGVRFASTNLK